MLRFYSLLILTVLQLTCFAQKNAGAEQDYYVMPGGRNVVVPTFYYQTGKNWLAMMRYNYEEAQTLTLYLGKTFAKKAGITYAITPLIGGMVGIMNGISVGTQVEASFGKVSFFSEPQFCISLENKKENFFYAWSEGSIHLTHFLYTGLALQQTKLYQSGFDAEPGLFAGVSIKNFDIPVYYFRSKGSTHYFVLGLHWVFEK